MRGRKLCFVIPLIAALVFDGPGCSTTPPPADSSDSDVDASDIVATPDSLLSEAGVDAPTADSRDAAACPADSRPDYPAGPYEINDNTILPNLHFTSLDPRGISFGDFYDPCAAPPRLLVVRNLAAWAGSARWHAEHTGRLMRLPNASRIAVLDLLVLGRDNVPATPSDLAAWRARYDTPPTALAIDPGYQMSVAFQQLRQVPLIFLVDMRTMRPVRILVAPEIQDLEYQIAYALAAMDGRRPPPAPDPATLYDGRFSEDRWDMIRAMTPVLPPPPSPTNAHADDPQAASLGQSLFNDARLSPTGVSCATCHIATRAFDDGLPTGHGVADLDRNTPSVVFAAYSLWQFWDGRADSLWSQALGPAENPAEMGSTRLTIAHVIADHYSAAYGAVFGALPPLSDRVRFPDSGRPGDASWTAMSAADQDAVNRVFANMGKAIEAFERTIRTRNSALDGYAAGNRNALSPLLRDGLLDFFNNGCIQCHYGPLLTDNSFHNIAMPTGRHDGQPDRGRIDAIAVLMASAFRADGPYSDDPTARSHLDGLVVHDSMLGQFRTPAMRASAAMGPWGHGGTFATLEDVIRHYGTRNEPDPVPGTVGVQDLHLGSFHVMPPDLTRLADVVRAATADPLFP